MRGITSQADVEAIEAQGYPSDLPESTYEVLRRTAVEHPEAPALSFFARATDFGKAERWTYRQLFAKVTRTANMFHSLGAGKDSVIAFVLPNLPETHFVIWGGQAAGIVAAINPMLEPDAIAELLNAVEASILVTLAPFPDSDLWQKLRPVLDRVTSLQHVLLVSSGGHVAGSNSHAREHRHTDSASGSTMDR